MKNWTIRVFSGLSFALAVFLLNAFVLSYLPSGPELLRDPDFSQKLKFWDYYGEEEGFALADGEVRLRNVANTRNVSLRQKIKWSGALPHLQLSADLRCENIAQGKRSWHLGRLVLPRYDAKAHWLNLPHYVAALTGTHSWKHYEQVFEYDPEAKSAEVALQLPYATGLLAARHLSLRAAVPNPFYPWAQGASFLFGGMFLWLLLSPHLFGSGSLWLRGSLFLVSAAILAGTLAPLAVKKDITRQIRSLPVFSVMNDPDEGVDPSTSLFEIGSLEARLHFCGFLLFGALLCALGAARDTILVGFFLACATELMQNFVPGRTPLISDMLIDVAGVTTGMMIFTVARWKSKGPLRL